MKTAPEDKAEAPILVAGLLLAVFYHAGLLLCDGHPVWGNIDDMLMTMIAAGVLYVDQPCANPLFINPLYGELTI